MTPVLTDTQKADAAHVASLAEDREVVRLDLRDERQFRHAVDMHILAGQTPNTHPGLHRALAEARARQLAEDGPGERDAADQEGFQTGAAITAVTKLTNTQAAASEGFASVLGGAAMLTVALTVTDPSYKLLACGSNEQYGDGTYLSVTTKPAGALPAESEMTAALLYTYQAKVGDPIISERVEFTWRGALADPYVSAPVKTEKKSGDPNIRIGLGRGPATQPKDDVDYWFWQQQDNTTYAVPLVGQVDFAAPIATPLSINVTGYLARGKGDPNPLIKGGIEKLPDDQKTNIINHCQVAGNRLRWSLPGGSVKDPNNPGSPIIWGKLPWSSDEVVQLLIQFEVQLQGQRFPALAAIQSSSRPDSNPRDGVATIPPLEFIYHCIAADARIALANGSERRLDEIDQQVAVRSAGDGSDLEIVSTWAANHRGPAIRLDAGGRELVLSGNHLVLTPGGPRRADSLSAGETINVANGTAELNAAEVVQYDGVLANLSFSYPSERVDPARNSMLANGIAVCDRAAQTQFQAELRDDPERILSVLDPMFHEDFRNYLQRTAAARDLEATRG
jgi:hypothetical protein